jgi:sporulation protein YunB
VAVLLGGALFAAFCGAVNARLRPAMETLAVSRATNRISETVSQAVSGCVAQQGLSYSDLVTVETDESGQVTSLSRDLSAVSQLQAQLVSEIADALDPLLEESFELPLGTLTGWLALSGRGPTVRVELVSAGDVVVNMSYDFEDAGINQTLHRVLADISVTIFLLIPGETLSATVDSQVCVAETVIVGQVPDTYLYIGNGAG